MASRTREHETSHETKKPRDSWKWLVSSAVLALLGLPRLGALAAGASVVRYIQGH